MSFDWSHFDIFTDKDTQLNKNDCCSSYDEIIKDGYKTCTNCGALDIENQPLVFYNDPLSYHKSNYYPYKRLVYFKQKLNYINGMTYYKPSPKLMFFIESNKGKNIRSILKLRRAMLSAGLSKSYKYIYLIYFLITGRKLIEIPINMYPTYMLQFIQLEKYFKKNNVKKCLYSYSVIICLLMKINKSTDYKNLLLPLNRKKLQKKIIQLLSMCGYSFNLR